MANVKIVYADASEATADFDGEPNVLFEQLFSHLPDDTKKLCSVTAEEPQKPTKKTAAKHEA